MVVEIHEDQVILEPATPWIRQKWIQMIAELGIGPALPFTACVLGPGDRAAGSWMIPWDFTALSTFDLVLSGNFTGVYLTQIVIEFGQLGEVRTVHNQTINPNIALVNTILTGYGLLAAFPALLANLVPGDIIKIWFRNNAAWNHEIYGINARYV